MEWSGINFYTLSLGIIGPTATVLIIGSIGPMVFYAYSQKEIYPDWKRRLFFLPVMVVIGTGIAVVNTRAWLEAVLGIQSGFKRTPKMKIESKADNLADRMKYTIPLDIHVGLEFLMGCYCAFCIYLCLALDKPYVIGFLVLYSIGFFYVAFQSMREAFIWRKKSPSTIQQDVSTNPA
jgi:hypothetical protein